MPEFILQPRPQVTRTTHWGEPKRCRSGSITDTGYEIWTNLAERAGCNNSEYLERVLRQLSAESLDELNRPQ